jgi:hypothetical protein
LYATANHFFASFLLGITVPAASSAQAVDSSVWEASINSQTKERFIPVELWTGANWGGQKELKMAPSTARIVIEPRPITSKGRSSGNIP